MRRPIILLLLTFAPVPVMATGTRETPPPLFVQTAIDGIRIDGRLHEQSWARAQVHSAFFDIYPGDSAPPPTQTRGRITFDERNLYVGVHCLDPDPSRIRAPFVARDNVSLDQDYIEVTVHSRGDGRFSRLFRVNARGSVADAVQNDDTLVEDFAPDFSFEAGTTIDSTGWYAEFRIPFSSLDGFAEPGKPWRVIFFRSYPREYSYQINSHPLPRNYNCFMCSATQLRGVVAAETGSRLLVPNFTAAERLSGSYEDAGFGGDKAEIGLDLEWRTANGLGTRATMNPDFSQLESDVPQLNVNSRRALFFPEKRPFFLEGAELLQMPIQAAHTRTVTDPEWGVQAGGSVGGSPFLLLVTRDRGGGSVVIPGASGSSFAPQSFESMVLLGRYQGTLGKRGAAGLFLSLREISGGGYNRLIGPDLRWRFGDNDQLTAQFLMSDTKNPNQAGRAEAWDGNRATSSGAAVRWEHTADALDGVVEYTSTGGGFRADNGFVPTAGLQTFQAEMGIRMYPSGLLRFLRPFAGMSQSVDETGRRVEGTVYPGLEMGGKRGLYAVLTYRPSERLLAPKGELAASYLEWSMSLVPGEHVPRLSVAGRLGEAFDHTNSRVGMGGRLTASVKSRPIDRLEIQTDSELEWLNIQTASGTKSRLFDAWVVRGAGYLHLSPRLCVRLVVEHLSLNRDPSLYSDVVERRDHSLDESILLSYRMNWRTFLFLGFGESWEGSALDLQRRRVFFKVSFAIEG